MDEIGEKVFKLKREELKALLKGVPFIPTDEEKSLLEKWKAEISKSTYDTPIIMPRKSVRGAICDDAQESFLDTTEETIVLPSQDMMKKKRDELRQRGILHPDEQDFIWTGVLAGKSVQDKWILNDTVKVLFDNESLLKVYQGVNIPYETGQNMDDFDGVLKQKREELRKLLLSNKKVPLINNEDDFSTIVIARKGALYIDEDKCEKDYQKNFQVKEEQTRKTTT